MTRKEVVLCLVVLMISVWNGTVLADVAPSPTMIELSQNGSDVEIVLSDPGYTAYNDFYIEREQSGQGVVRISDIDLSEDAAVSSEALCIEKFWEPTFCELYPEACLTDCDDSDDLDCIGETCEDCIEDAFMFTSEVEGFCDMYPDYRIDCDGDGVPECCGSGCLNMYEHLVVDYSVPPGMTTYNIVIDEDNVESKEINVTDWTDGCSVTSVGGASQRAAMIIVLFDVFLMTCF